MISTRQRGIYSIAHKKRAIVTNTIEKMMAKMHPQKWFDSWPHLSRLGFVFLFNNRCRDDIEEGQPVSWPDADLKSALAAINVD